MLRHTPIIATVAALIVAAAASARDEEAYWALFNDGSHVAADRFTRGQSWDDQTELAGRRLFDPANPVRVLCNTSLECSSAETYVQMANGDVVPGRVRQWLPASPELGLPQRLLISLRGVLRSPDPDGLAVRADRVLRVISGGTAVAEREPGTLVLASGRTAVATALRWTEAGVKALTVDGIVTAGFDQLAELHVPKVDMIEALLDDGQYPPLDEESLIGRLETVDGAVLTYRRRMTRVAFPKVTDLPPRRRDDPAPTRLIHMQPSWSLSPILLPVDAVYRRNYRAAGELPLSQLPAEVVGRQHGIHHWPWRRNRSVQGEALQSGRITVGLGLGTHSHSEIAFDLPPRARQFTTMVGLDDRVGDGGCVRVKVYRDRVSGRPLFSSGLLRGTDDPVPVGPLNLAGAERLVLVTEFAHDDRPPGADPFDVRDEVDWLLPTVTVEPQDVERDQLRRRFVPGWQMWTPDAQVAGRLNLSAKWDEALDRWVPVIHARGDQPVVLRRTVSPVSRANDLLELNVAPAEVAEAAEIELRVGGALVEPITAEFITEWRKRNSYQYRKYPFLVDHGLILRWDLKQYHGQNVELELSMVIDENGDGLQWRHGKLHSAIAGLPPDGQPLMPDVRLTSLKPIDVDAPREKALPAANGWVKLGGRSRPLKFLDQPFRDGYGMIQDSRVSFPVESSYKRFVAAVGCCEDQAGPFRVQLDDEVVWTGGPLSDRQQAVWLSIEIPPGTKKLTLATGGEGAYASYAAWVDAGFCTQ